MFPVLLASPGSFSSSSIVNCFPSMQDIMRKVSFDGIVNVFQQAPCRSGKRVLKKDLRFDAAEKNSPD
eukprot:1379566-Ditylum_brightwellii.AAC.1